MNVLFEVWQVEKRQKQDNQMTPCVSSNKPESAYFTFHYMQYLKKSLFAVLHDTASCVWLQRRIRNTVTYYAWTQIFNKKIICTRDLSF